MAHPDGSSEEKNPEDPEIKYLSYKRGEGETKGKKGTHHTRRKMGPILTLY